MKEIWKFIDDYEGYLPSDMNVNLLSDNFNKGVSLLVNPQEKQ